MSPAGGCRGDLFAETPVLRRGFASRCGFQRAVEWFGLLLVCRFFASLRMTKKVVLKLNRVFISFGWKKNRLQ